MPLTTLRALCASTAILFVLGAAPALAAAPTATAIVTPTAAQAGDTFSFTSGVTTPDLSVTGTSNGNTGQVRIGCWYRDPAGVPQVRSGPPLNVAADGQFSGTALASSLTYCPGTLRAVPNGMAITTQDQLAPFTGPPARYAISEDYLVSGSTTPENNGRSYDYYLTTQGAKGFFDIDSASSCGIDDGFVNNGDQIALIDFYCNGGFFANIHYGTAYRSGLQVDGHNAYLADAAYIVSKNYPGMPFLTWSRVYDPATGNMTITEASGVVRCPTDTFDANTASGNCASWIDTGVVLNRVTVVSHEGRMLRQTDVFTSSSGEHAVDLMDWEAWRSYTATQSWVFPGGAAGTHMTDAEVIPIPAQTAPSSIAVQHDPSQPGDSLNNPRSAVSMWPAGDSYKTSGTGNSQGYLHYAVTVPASGSLTMERVYTHDWRAAEAASLQNEAEDLLAKPTLALTAPADAAIVNVPAVTVTGTATDNKTVSVTVNGAAATVTAGAFSKDVALTEGANTLTVVASDGAGNQVTATRSVTYVKPVVPPVVVAPGIGKSGTVSCPAGGPACTASATWTSVKTFGPKGKKRKVVLARWSAKIAAGKKATARAHLTKSGKALLGKRSLKAVRRISARAGTGAPKTARRTVTLKKLKKQA
ncbi:MAG: hypothetical protein JWM73_1283 [Solirubrobacterales bacterium]|nr:hypothetical protein [Solirubrobacterales bacterium]